MEKDGTPRAARSSSSTHPAKAQRQATSNCILNSTRRLITPALRLPLRVGGIEISLLRRRHRRPPLLPVPVPVPVPSLEEKRSKEGRRWRKGKEKAYTAPAYTPSLNSPSTSPALSVQLLKRGEVPCWMFVLLDPPHGPLPLSSFSVMLSLSFVCPHFAGHGHGHGLSRRSTDI